MCTSGALLRALRGRRGLPIGLAAHWYNTRFAVGSAAGMCSPTMGIACLWWMETIDHVAYVRRRFGLLSGETSRLDMHRGTRVMLQYAMPRM